MNTSMTQLEIYEWSKITHENIKDFYENVKKKDNYVKNLHRGCAMMAHLRFLSNDDFKDIYNRFEEFGLFDPKDYYHFMEALVELKIFGVNMLDSSILEGVKTYRKQFDEARK